MHRHRIVAAAITVAFVLAACGADEGSSDGADEATRTVDVAMVDIAYEPDTLEVKQGETVRFVFTNRGKVAHDAFIGDHRAQEEHEADMSDPDADDHGGHGDDEDAAVTVAPGEREELTYTFDEAGTVEIGCHQPGHYAAGMKIAVDVT